MWTAVSIINPLMALMAVLVIPLAQVQDNQEALLSFMGERAGGAWLGTLISIDATLVLCGAVLTSFVGVSGLIRRMTLDRILPQFLLKENRRGSSPRILLLFYLLCLSVLYITAGQLAPLAGVYTISFLLVMAFFALGNFLLKFKRERLPRPEQAAPFAVAVALVAVLAAVYGNMRMHPEYLVVFIQYFVPSFLIIYLMLHRNALLRYAIVVLDSLMLGVRRLSVIGRRLLTTGLHRLSQQEFVYFTKGDDIAVLNKVMMYVEENEMTRRLKVVTVLKAGERAARGLPPRPGGAGPCLPRSGRGTGDAGRHLRPRPDPGTQPPVEDPDQLHVHRIAGRPLPLPDRGPGGCAADHLITRGTAFASLPPPSPTHGQYPHHRR
ncbi:MAG: amino acid permease [Flavobacteriales bacterium]